MMQARSGLQFYQPCGKICFWLEDAIAYYCHLSLWRSSLHLYVPTVVKDWAALFIRRVDSIYFWIYSESDVKLHTLKDRIKSSQERNWCYSWLYWARNNLKTSVNLSFLLVYLIAWLRTGRSELVPARIELDYCFFQLCTFFFSILLLIQVPWDISYLSLLY